MNDLINRQDVIDSIVAWTVEDRPDIEMPTDLVDRVNALPSADASLMQDRCKFDASSNLINRQDAIGELWKALYDYEDKTEKQFLESEELNTADWFRHRIFVQNMSDIDRQTILNLPSAQQWIPCSERLPKPSEHTDDMVLVCTSDGKVRFGSCWYIRCICEGCVGDMPVVAWMPLPEPYEPQERSE